MKLIDDDHEELVSCWLSKKPGTKFETGLKAVINFNTKTIELIEESIERKEAGSILMSFEEFKNLRMIIEEKSRGPLGHKK